MSCRTTPAGSLATTFIQRAYGLQDGQCTSLFHAVRRESANLAPISATEYLDAIDRMERVIQQDAAWSPAMRERALGRVQSARTAGMPTDSAAARALVELPRRADMVSRTIDTYIATVAAAHNITTEQAEAEYRRLYHEAQEGQHATGQPPFSSNALPSDTATGYAFGVLLAGAGRCDTCGRFLPSDPSHSHVCPDLNAETATSSSTRRRPRIEEASAQVVEEVAAHAPEVNEPTIINPWSIDEFQEIYDRVKEKLQTGAQWVPTDFDLESIPGGVTGGLGAREGGNSFGIEIELDFPDEDYPYAARQEFARILHEEGIVRHPYVMRWHYVGGVGDDRDGGEYEVSPNDWSCEFDRSVDDVDGERGVEIKSQILYDEPETWKNIRRICEVAEQLGGRPTFRTGLHVNVGGAGFPSDDPSKHIALLRLANAYDDTLIRMAHNPASAPEHRGRAYCMPVHRPLEGFRGVDDVRSSSWHRNAFNLQHLQAQNSMWQSPDARVEVRIWDSSIDPGRIQAAITTSLAMVKAAEQNIQPTQGNEFAGSHREIYGRRTLTGEEWERSTESFRQLAAIVEKMGASTQMHREQLVTLFAASHWQRQ